MMAYDIYGDHLRRGYCEVHPDVHEEWPCSECLAESRARENGRQRYDEEMEAQRIQHDEEMRRQFETDCAEAVVAFLRFANLNEED